MIPWSGAGAEVRAAAESRAVPDSWAVLATGAVVPRRTAIPIASGIEEIPPGRRLPSILFTNLGTRSPDLLLVMVRPAAASGDVLRFPRHDLQMEPLDPAEHGQRGLHSDLAVGEERLQVVDAPHRALTEGDDHVPRR
jgi:hypothetical protein